MLYNVIKNSKVIDTLEIGSDLSKSKFRDCVKSYYSNVFSKDPGYVKVERLNKSNGYLILGRRNSLLFTIEEKKSVVGNVWAFLNKPIGEMIG